MEKDNPCIIFFLDERVIEFNHNISVRITNSRIYGYFLFLRFSVTGGLIICFGVKKAPSLINTIVLEAVHNLYVLFDYGYTIELTF